MKEDYLWKEFSGITECSSDNNTRSFRQTSDLFAEWSKPNNRLWVFQKNSSQSSCEWVGSSFGTAPEMFFRGPNFLRLSSEISYIYFFQDNWFSAKRSLEKYYADLTYLPKSIFSPFEFNCKNSFFSKVYIFLKKFIRTRKMQFWHHCDKMCAQLLNLFWIYINFNWIHLPQNFLLHT